MGDSRRSVAQLFLRGVSWLVSVAGILIFFYGGNYISSTTKTSRFVAEIEGIGIAVLLIGVGAITKSASKEDDEGD